MAKAAGALDDLLEQLYAADLDEFTAERNALVRSLRADGRDEDARELAERRKPPLPAFLANRLARERSRETGALIDAAETLSKAHRGGGVEKLRDAQAALNDALRTLVAAAPEVAGKPVSGPVEQRLVTTLRAAAADPETAGLLRRGVLSDEVDPSGFDALAGLPAAPRRKRGERKPKARSARTERADAARRERAERLERELSEAHDELRAAEREFAVAERAAERARRRVADLEKRLGSAREAQ
jgi:hypothetical protein